MNLTQLRSPSIFVLTLAVANLTMLGQDRPKPDQPTGRDGHGNTGSPEIAVHSRIGLA
jgi:hypothetical protein